jgi:hypothetical protein
VSASAFVSCGITLSDGGPDERAARVVRLAFAAGADDARLEQALRQLGGAQIAWERVEDELRASVRVDGEPREWLARFLSLPGLPPPRAIEHGKLSLADGAKLPSDLVEDFFFLRGQKVPSVTTGPMSMPSPVRPCHSHWWTRATTYRS